MPDPIQAMLAAGVVPSSDLAPTSRYAGVGTTTTPVGEEEVVHFRRRWVPAPEDHPLLRQVMVRQGDRRDTVAHAELGDAYLWWRLADADGGLDPDHLTRPPGRWVRITLAADPRHGSAADQGLEEPDA